jgi:hypothetical protein
LFAHGLDLFQGNGLLERLRVPVNDGILHGFAVPFHELLPGVYRNDECFSGESLFVQ